MKLVKMFKEEELEDLISRLTDKQLEYLKNICDEEHKNRNTYTVYFCRDGDLSQFCRAFVIRMNSLKKLKYMPQIHKKFSNLQGVNFKKNISKTDYDCLDYTYQFKKINSINLSEISKKNINSIIAKNIEHLS